MGYCLDSLANVTIAGNTTISGLSEGTHSLVVYANDTAGNTVKSETVFFTVQTAPSASPTTAPATSTPSASQPTAEHSPTSSPAETEKAGYNGVGSDEILIAVALFTVAATVGLALAFKIRKREKKSLR